MGKELLPKPLLPELIKAYLSEPAKVAANSSEQAGVRDGKSTKEKRAKALQVAKVQTAKGEEKRIRLRARNGVNTIKPTPTMPVSAKYWNQSL